VRESEFSRGGRAGAVGFFPILLWMRGRGRRRPKAVKVLSPGFPRVMDPHRQPWKSEILSRVLLRFFVRLGFTGFSVLCPAEVPQRPVRKRL